jgi:glycosyltransferase involved in cell wall biosynthesis
MTPDVSVCIATCRRPRGLARLLASLDRQKLPEGLALEIVVVDNDPDGTGMAVAEAHRALHPLRAFPEPRPNLARVRNRSVAEARGRWLAFADDDEEVDEGWIAGFWRAVDDTGADVLFGPVLPRLLGTPPGWLERGGFFVRPRHATGDPVARNEGRTGNAFVRRSLLPPEPFDPAFGGGGEDTELFARLHDRGARLSWCDEARVTELVPPERQRMGWLARRAFRAGRIHTRLERRRRSGAAADLCRGLRALAALAALVLALPGAVLCGRRVAARLGLRALLQAGHLRALTEGRAAPRGCG